MTPPPSFAGSNYRECFLQHKRHPSRTKLSRKKVGGAHRQNSLMLNLCRWQYSVPNPTSGDFFQAASYREETAVLPSGFTAVCVFVFDNLNETTLKKLADEGFQLITRRSAGFNNVDHRRRVRTDGGARPAYSPNAVAAISH
ncbi:MAG: hypothetical protein AB4352_01610 [Hormoscilla sp.]